MGQDDHVTLGMILLSENNTNASSSSLKSYLCLRGQSEVASINDTLISVPRRLESTVDTHENPVDQWHSLRIFSCSQPASIPGTDYCIHPRWLFKNNLHRLVKDTDSLSISLLTERQMHWSESMPLLTGEMEHAGLRE